MVQKVYIMCVAVIQGVPSQVGNWITIGQCSGKT